jgi:hypothetical protein
MVESGHDGGVSGGADDGDPEVTEISRRYDRTGDTLDAIQQLEQLIVRRTGQIPVVTPEMLAAAAAAKRGAVARDDTAPPPLLQPPATVETPVVPAQPDAKASVDFDLPAPVELDPAPTFSPWVDPELVAAAQAGRVQAEYADISTAVFTLFSAQPEQAAAAAEHALPPAPEPEALAPAPESGIPVPLPVHREDDDGLDHDVVDDAAQPHELPAELVPQPAVAPAPEPAPKPQKRRRLWPFGRR